MIKLDNVYADFQIIDHRILLCNFEYPKRLIESSEEIEFGFDYKVIKSEHNESTLYGVVLYQVNVSYQIEERQVDLIDTIIEGRFVGNPHAFDLDEFSNMLSINGIATLAQIIRTHIQNVCLMANLKFELMVPMINVLELKRIKEDECVSE